MFLDINGNSVFALDFGSGPRTFLAHSGWIGNFEDWIATLAPMSKTWRTVIYDHRGAGETRVPVDRITPQSLVDDLFAVMGELEIDRCVLGGFSRGTVTTLRAVLQRPERFEGLVLMNGSAGVQVPGAEWSRAAFRHPNGQETTLENGCVGLPRNVRQSPMLNTFEDGRLIS